MSSKFKRFIQSWIINTLAVLIAVNVLPGIYFTNNKLASAFIVSFALGILNAFIRPILILLALPLVILTLGLFMLVINALLLYMVSLFPPAQLQIDGFGWAFAGAAVIAIVSSILNFLTGTGRSRIEFKRGRRPPDSNHGGDGPVIDI